MDDKIRFDIEFPIHASPQLLYQYISRKHEARKHKYSIKIKLIS